MKEALCFTGISKSHFHCGLKHLPCRKVEEGKQDSTPGLGTGSSAHPVLTHWDHGGARRVPSCLLGQDQLQDKGLPQNGQGQGWGGRHASHRPVHGPQGFLADLAVSEAWLHLVET